MKRFFLLTLTIICLQAVVGHAYAQSSYGKEQSRAREMHLLYGKLPRFAPPSPLAYPQELYRKGIPIDFKASSFQFDSRINGFLSTACSKGSFNQQRVNRYVVTLRAYNGRFEKRVGFASSRGLNLLDPNQYAQEGFFYLFDQDGTSSCRVSSFQE